jgi:hypothetical protein
MMYEIHVAFQRYWMKFFSRVGAKPALINEETHTHARTDTRKRKTRDILKDKKTPEHLTD